MRVALPPGSSLRTREYIASIISQTDPGDRAATPTGPTVQVLVDTIDAGPLTFTLTFGDRDLLACRMGEAGGATAGIRFDGRIVDEMWNHRLTGTSAVMSGWVTLEGHWEQLADVRRALQGPGFHAWINRLHVPSKVSRSFSLSRGGPPVIAVLGATNDDNGRLSPMAEARAAKAVQVWRTMTGAKLVLTGGFGEHFNNTDRPHWQYVAGQLKEQGIPPGDIIAVAESRHTYEDILFLREILALHRPRRIVVVTSDYHAARVRSILDLVLPVAGLAVARSDELDDLVLASLSAHDRGALGRTVVAASLFGPDLLIKPLTAVSLGWTACWRSGLG